MVRGRWRIPTTGTRAKEGDTQPRRGKQRIDASLETLCQSKQPSSLFLAQQPTQLACQQQRLIECYVLFSSCQLCTKS